MKRRWIIGLVLVVACSRESAQQEVIRLEGEIAGVSVRILEAEGAEFDELLAEYRGLMGKFCEAYEELGRGTPLPKKTQNVAEFNCD